MCQENHKNNMRWWTQESGKNKRVFVVTTTQSPLSSRSHRKRETGIRLVVCTRLIDVSNHYCNLQLIGKKQIKCVLECLFTSANSKFDFYLFTFSFYLYSIFTVGGERLEQF